MSVFRFKNKFVPEGGDLELLKRIVRQHCLTHQRTYIAIVLLMALASACTAAAAYLLGAVVNTIYARKEYTAIIALAVGMLALFSVKGFAVYGHAMLLARVGNSVIAETQRNLIDKLLHESISFFSAVHSSEIVTRAGQGAVAASNILNLLVVTLGRDLLTLVSLFGVMIWQDPALTAIGLCVMPLAALGVRELMKRSMEIARRRMSGNEAIQQGLQETVQGIRVIKSFTGEDRVRARLSTEIDSIAEFGNKLASISNRSTPLVESLGGFAVALVCLYCGYRVVELGDDPGRFVSFMAAFLLAFDPAKRISRLNIELGSQIVAVRTIYDLLDSPPTEPDDSHLPAIVFPQGRVTFDNVCFAYREDTPVLKGISFTAEPGSLTALAGPSGGGKSTILNVLSRFYDPQSGAIKVDGYDISSMSRHSLRSQIAYVGQDVFLFKGTIRYNIMIGRQNADNADMEAAAKAAFAHDFISAFPQGYDTEVGEFGWKLSLGQRQRVAIARAILKDARIVLLDEATASLDSESEQYVQTALARLCEGRTTIVIAHRLTTIRHADCIFVVEGGKIVESGSEKDLLSAGGRYVDFFRLQFPGEAAGISREGAGAAG